MCYKKKSRTVAILPVSKTFLHAHCIADASKRIKGTQADKEDLMPTAIPPSLALSMPLSEHNTNKMAALDMLLQCAGIIWRWAQGGKTCSCNVLNPETVIVIHFTTFTL